MLAHPADLPGRYAGHQGIGLYVAIDYRTRGDKSIFAHGNTANNRAVGAERRTFLDCGRTVLILSRDGSARIVDICEDHAGAAEDVVFKGHGIVDADIVLHFYVATDPHVIGYEYVLTEGTSFADPRPAGDVYPVPDAGASANLGAVVDDGGGVGCERHISIQVARKWFCRLAQTGRRQ